MPLLAKLKTLFSPSSSPSAQSTTSAPQQQPIPTTTVTPPTPNPSSFSTNNMAPAPSHHSAIDSTAATSEGADAMAPLDQKIVGEQAAFDRKEVTVVFVLGGPGAGKGTQCARLVKDYGFVHLSAGDLLRAEQQRSGSSVGKMIKEYITEGKIVPMEVTIKLLENAMREAVEGGKGKRFLVDGFPRQMDQAVKFDESVCPSSLILFLVCPEPILLERLLERGKTSGRDDDNEQSIKKRFQTFITTSMPVVEYYKKQQKVVEIDSSKSIDDVYADIVKGIEPVLEAKEA